MENLSLPAIAWLVFFAAAVLEVCGDAAVRQGLRGGRWAFVVLGCLMLAGYGLVVNLVKWDFSQLLRTYTVLQAGGAADRGGGPGASAADCGRRAGAIRRFWELRKLGDRKLCLPAVIPILRQNGLEPGPMGALEGPRRQQFSSGSKRRDRGSLKIAEKLRKEVAASAGG